MTIREAIARKIDEADGEELMIAVVMVVLCSTFPILALGCVLGAFE